MTPFFIPYEIPREVFWKLHHTHFLRPQFFQNPLANSVYHSILFALSIFHLLCENELL